MLCANGSWKCHRFAQPAPCMWRKCCSGWCGNNYLNTIHVSLHHKPFDGTSGVKVSHQLCSNDLQDFTILLFWSSPSQVHSCALCSRIPQSASRVETVQLTAAAKRCHRRSNSFTHQTSTKSTWTHRRVTVLNFEGKKHWCSNAMVLLENRPTTEGQKIMYHWLSCCAVSQLLFVHALKQRHWRKFFWSSTLA